MQGVFICFSLSLWCCLSPLPVFPVEVEHLAEISDQGEVIWSRRVVIFLKKKNEIKLVGFLLYFVLGFKCFCLQLFL